MRISEFIKLCRGELILGILWLAKSICKAPGLRGIYHTLLIYLIKKTNLFDSNYYLETNPDIAQKGIRPLRHYAVHGDRKGRLPMPLFDPNYYRHRIKSRTKRVNALLHYAYVGRYKRISPSPWFNVQHYLSQNKDVARSGYEPIQHYLKFGGAEGRSPNLQFDSQFYLRSYSDVREAGLNPLLHYIYAGRQEGRLTRDPSGAKHIDKNGSPKSTVSSDEICNWERLDIQIKRDGIIPLIDVIVPVYKNRILTWRCLSSVLQARNTIAFELIVVEDCSPEPQISADLKEISARGWITLIRNDSNLGFVCSINKGISQHRDRDVVILNSDTEVYDGWLDRLHQAAYSSEKVASVTPLSNNATICSYPRFLHDNPYPLEVDYPTLDRLAMDVNAGVTVETPTGVGFCMYLRRTALDIVGDFDEASFGKGYGEENDWCQRAITQGWRNLIASYVFVRHIGGASFLGEKGKRVTDAMRVLAKLHPTYNSQVKQFTENDPLRESRQRLDWARLKHQKKHENALMVCHNRGGGAEKYLLQDASALANKGMGVFFMRPYRDRPSHVLIQHQTCRQLLNLPSFRLSDTDVLSKVIRELGIISAHCHGLVDFEPDAPAQLLQLCQTAVIKLYVDIHDYKVICPRINLVDENGLYCREPDISGCNVCLSERGNDFGVTDIEQWRKLHHSVLCAADQLQVPNKDVAERLSRYYPDLQLNVTPHEEIAPHEIKLRTPHLSHNEKLTIVIIGAIGKIKGFDVIRACAKDAKQRNLHLNFVLMGHTIRNRLLLNEGIKITGKYHDDNALELLEKINPHVVFLPSLWPETYSYTLSIALKAGLPVFAFDIGAIAARLKEAGLADHLMPISHVGTPSQINDEFLKYRNTHLINNSVTA